MVETKLSIIITTARTESETDYSLFQKKISDKDYIWSADDDDDWWEMKTCIDPKHESFLQVTLESLLRQWDFDPKDIQVIIVDRLRSARPQISGLYGKKFGQFNHVADKPSIWHDLKPPKDAKPLQTDHPIAYTAICNARNTGYLYVHSPVVIHLDECSIVGPKFCKSAWYWYDRHRASMKGYRHIIRFLQKESFDTIEIDDSQTIIDREFGDWWRNRESFKLYDTRGTWTYYSLPFDWILQVNGWEELFDGNVGAEDLEFGYRIAQLPQAKMFLDRDAKVWELSTRHIQWKRPHVKFNEIFFDYFLFDLPYKRHKFVKANNRQLTRKEVDNFIRWHERERVDKGRGTIAPNWDKPHPYIYKLLEVKPFSLVELRKQYGSNS